MKFPSIFSRIPSRAVSFVSLSRPSFGRAIGVALLLASLAASSRALAQCDAVTVNASDAGWYTESGYHDPANNNYLAGDYTTGLRRNWFVFDVPPLTTVASAELRIYAGSIRTPDASETYELHEVTTAIPELRAGGTGRTNIFNDLGDGPEYGSRTIISSEANQFISIPLNAAFLQALQTASGGQIAIGGRLTTLDGVTLNSEYVFGNSFGAGGNVQLVITAGAADLSITASPLSQTALAGSSVTFSVAACGTPPLSYQWQFNGANLAGATDSTLELSSVSADQAGNYRAVVSSSGGAVTSAVAVLTVESLLINFQPQSQAVLIGQNVFFSVGVSSFLPVGYQWQFNGANLPGANSSSLNLYNVTTNQAGGYTVVVSNSAGAVTSAVAVLTVSALAIYAQPQSQTALAGQPVFFNVGVSSYLPVSYQWQFNGSDLPGRTFSYLDLHNLTTNQAGDYSVVVSNAVVTVTSTVARLTVNLQAPVITEPPRDQTVFVGQNAYFNVSAIGSPPPEYQWLFDGAALPGATNHFLYLPDVTTNQAGAYTLVASNLAGVVTSAVARLVVMVQAPVFVNQPFSETHFAGESVYFYAYATGGPEPTYQWLFNGVALPGATNYTLQLFNVSTNHEGDYTVVASNLVGVVTSAVARVTVLVDAPVFVIQPVSQERLVGGAAYFAASALGVPLPAYQWQFNGVDLPDATNSSLYLPDLAVNQSGNYTVVAYNIGGAVTSAVATLTVSLQAPVFYAEPASQTLLVGQTAFLQSGASGAPPPAYQWQFNGVDLPGATNLYLYVYNATTNQAGAYTVVASNVVGVVTSAVATLTVELQAPVFVQQPLDASALAGHDVSFYSYAQGGPPPTYQWQFDGADLPDATNSYLTLLNVATNQAGAYTVVASNIVGVVTSEVATLTVSLQAPVFYREPYSQSELAGYDVYFDAGAVGGPPPTYQWQFNGVDLPDATNSYLYVLNVTTNQAGDYTVVASNFLAAVTSVVATLTVQVAAPANLNFSLSPAEAVEGSVISFYASAFGGPPPSLTLQLNGTNLAFPFRSYGFALLEATTNDVGAYTVVASNFLGAITSQVATLTITPAGPLDRWTRRNPLPQGNHLLSVAQGNGTFVAVGESGAILTSVNGTNWTVESLRTDVQLSGVTYGNGQFVAVGDGGTILTSPDGVNWTLRFSNTAVSLSAVAYGNGRFVAVGLYDSVILTSTDGVTWTSQTLPFYFNLTGLAFGRGTFVAVGGGGIVFTSTDGMAWTQRNSGITDSLESVAFVNNVFVAVGSNGRILVSSSGTLWTGRTSGTSRRLLGVAYGTGKFVVVGTRGTILSSPNTVNWTAEDSTTTDRLEGITFANGQFVAAGENGTTLTSTDGAAWAKQNLGTTRDLDGMTLANGLIVVAGKFGTILTSTDGVRYTQQDSGTTNDLHGVGYGGGIFVAVGEPGVILTSSNGVQWTPQTPTGNNYFKSVAYGNGTWVAVGTQGDIFTSADGASWTRQDAGASDDLNEVAYGNGTFVVVGDHYQPNGTVLVSADGVSWANRSVNIGKNLRGVTFANGLFMAAGNDGVLLVSTNAISWEARNSGLFFNGQNLRHISYANGLWVVVGNEGIILTSTNTYNWTRRVSRTLENLHGVETINGTLVAIGNRGTILQSARFIGAMLLVRTYNPAVGFEFAINSEPGRTHRLQGSTDLRTWTDLFTFNNTQMTTVFLDEEAIYLSRRFYRVVSP